MSSAREMNFKFDAHIASSFGGNMRKFWGALTQSNQHLNQVARSQRAVSRGAGSMGQGIGGMAKGLIGLAAGYLTFQGLKSAYTSVTDASNGYLRAMTRLETTMMNVKGTRKEDVEAIKQQANALQNVTTMDDDVTAFGASQLATFQLQGKAIQKMLPSMQDFMVGQFGMNVSQEQAQTGANMLGKALMGMPAGLAKAGITMSKSEISLLKNGDQMQKVATLAKVIENNYGGMAQALAKTPEGQIIQLKNAWGDLQQEVGLRVTPAMLKVVDTIVKNLPAIQAIFTSVMNGVDKGIALLKPYIDIFKGWFAEAWKAIQPLVGKFQEDLKKLGPFMKTVFEAVKPALQWIITKGFPLAVSLGEKIFRFVVNLGPVVRTLAPVFQFVFGVIAKVMEYTLKVAGWILDKVNGILEMANDIHDLNEQTKNNDERTDKMQVTMRNRTAQAYKATGANQAQVQAIVRQEKHLTGPWQGNWSKYELDYLRKTYPDKLKQPVKPFANGGLVTRPTLGLVGEAGPELIIPLNRMPMGGMTLQQTVHVHGAGKDAKEIGREVANMTEQGFKRMYEQMMQRNGRLGYSS
ncbi:MAG: hypothetical protein ACYDBB_21525 [Armatimonadota bacterium]